MFPNQNKCFQLQHWCWLLIPVMVLCPVCALDVQEAATPPPLPVPESVQELADPERWQEFERYATVLDPGLYEPVWVPDFSRQDGLDLEIALNIALEQNRPLRNVREDLRTAQISLDEEIRNFDTIYALGAGAYYDENARFQSGGDWDISRYSFSFGGPEGSSQPDALASRRFSGGGSISLNNRTTYHQNVARSNLVDDIRWFSETNIILSQPLLEGAGAVATTDLRLRRLDDAISKLRLEWEIQSLIQSVVTAYLDAQRRISLTLVRQNSYHLAVEQFYRLKLKSTNPASDVTPLQLLRAEQQVASTRQQLMDAKNSFLDALVNLRLVLGAPPDSTILLRGHDIPDSDQPVISVSDAVAYARFYRADLRSEELALRQSAENLKRARNGLLPNLDLSASMNFVDGADNFGESFGRSIRYEDVRAGLSLAIPLNQPSDQANYQRAQVLSRKAINSLEQKHREVTSHVDRAYRQQATLYRRIAVLQRNEELARQTYQTLNGLSQYENIDPFDLAAAQDDWTAASAERVGAEIDYLIALSELDLAMGRPVSEVLSRYTFGPQSTATTP